MWPLTPTFFTWRQRYTYNYKYLLISLHRYTYNPEKAKRHGVEFKPRCYWCWEKIWNDEREEATILSRKNWVKPVKTKKQNPEYERELELVDNRWHLGKAHFRSCPSIGALPVWRGGPGWLRHFLEKYFPCSNGHLLDFGGAYTLARMVWGTY